MINIISQIIKKLYLKIILIIIIKIYIIRKRKKRLGYFRLVIYSHSQTECKSVESNQAKEPRIYKIGPLIEWRK